jgi:hypothetical protein
MLGRGLGGGAKIDCGVAVMGGEDPPRRVFAILRPGRRNTRSENCKGEQPFALTVGSDKLQRCRRPGERCPGRTIQPRRSAYATPPAMRRTVGGRARVIAASHARGHGHLTKIVLRPVVPLPQRGAAGAKAADDRDSPDESGGSKHWRSPRYAVCMATSTP